MADQDPDGEDVELGRRPSRWWAVVAVVAVVGLLAAGAVASGGRASRAIDRTTTTSSTSTTEPAPSTTRPARTTTTSTTVVRPLRTTVDGAPFLEVASPPGLVLYGVSRDNRDLWRIDLLTGAATVRSLGGRAGLGRDVPYGTPVDLLPRSGGVVLWAGGAAAAFVPDDLDAPVVDLGATTYWPLAHADPSRLWRIVGDPDQVRAEVIDLSGTVVEPVVDVPAGYPLADDGTGRLLVTVASTYYALGTDGSVSRLTTQPLVGVRGDRIVVVECAAGEVRCELVVRRRDDGTEIARLAADQDVAQSGLSVLSPSGTALAVYSYGDGFGEGGLVVLPLDGAPATRFDFQPGPSTGGSPPLWWVDDGLLCGVGNAGHVSCFRVGDLEAAFELTDLVPGGVSSIALTRP